MSAIVATLGALWSALAGVVTAVSAWLVGVLAWVVGGIVAVVLGALTVLVGLLPAAPAPGSQDLGALEQLAVANQYVPVSEGLAMLAVWSALFAGVGVYKLLKFIRGAG